ncbi:hypothetical protein K502DRAFT_26198 [Neoconidiobolus thromboides FSU 785]|nr:hypothetical protein K502DRAFT_26198 [Neoconidiobolus thromboides FSU 785]
MSFLSLLMNWLIGMSSCNYRPFRITATSLALNIMSFLSEGCSEIEHNKNNAIKQMKKKKSNLGEKKKQMEKQSELEEQLNQFEAILELFFDKVFEPRYRDIDNNIRAECASELASFTLKYPTYFLNNEHLKYLGWLLSDKASNVRNEALAGISIILKKEGISTFIQQFISNYKERILEMGLKEIELNVKCSAIKLIYKLHQNGLLDEDEKKKMINVLFSKEEKVQKSIAPFIKYVIIEEMIPEISKDVLETNKGKLKENEINQLGVKCLLQILLDSKLDFLNHNENGLLDIIDGFSLASKVTQNNMITTIVTALWDQLEFIKDWKTLIELSGQQNKQNRKRGIKLNEKEDILLLKIMQVAFKLLLEESKLNDINQEKLEKKSIEIHPFINLKDYLLQEARPFDALINKYFSNDEAIISVLKLIEITLNGELFLDAGKMKSYEHLLLQINKLFLTHSDTLVLYQITLSLKSLATFDTIPPQEFQSFIEKLFDDIADKIVLYKNDAENILPELQRLRVLFILNDWGINLIYYKKTEILEIFIQLIELGDQNQIDINLKILNIEFIYGYVNQPLTIN